MKKTVRIISIIFAVLLIFSACGQSNGAGAEAETAAEAETVVEAENTTVVEDEAATRTILLWASGAHMDTPYDGPIANSLNRMMEEEIPDSVNIIVLTGGTEEGWSWDLSLEGGDGSRDYSEFL